MITEFSFLGEVPFNKFCTLRVCSDFSSLGSFGQDQKSQTVKNSPIANTKKDLLKGDGCSDACTEM